MNILPQDLLYECLFFLDWDEYHDVCKHLNIDFKFNIYFRNRRIPSYISTCNSKIERLEIVKYLYSINKNIKVYHKDLAIANGHINVVNFLHSVNQKFDNKSIVIAIDYNQSEIVKFLYQHIHHSNRLKLIERAKRGKCFDIVNFLQNQN